MEKFKVGDKVRYVRGVWFRDGEELYICKIDRDDGEYLLGPEKGMSEDNIHALWVEENEFELIEPSPNLSEEIYVLKRKVAELEERLTELEPEPIPEITFSISATDLAELRPKKSANERRKEAIEKAKKIVAITDPFITEFIVNEEKRTVVALIRGSLSRKIRAKGIAKCAPSDVFNVHIGKAIALGRAYGLDVSEFEQAPQPTEPVLGMVVEVEGIFHPYVDPVISGSHYRNGIDALREYPERLIRIISDSEAQY